MADISLAAETVFHLGPLPVTNSLLTTWLVVVLIIVGSLMLKRRVAERPGGLQNVVESVMEGGLGLMDSVTQDRKQTLKYFPFVFTLFIFN